MRAIVIGLKLGLLAAAACLVGVPPASAYHLPRGPVHAEHRDDHVTRYRDGERRAYDDYDPRDYRGSRRRYEDDYYARPRRDRLDEELSRRPSRAEVLEHELDEGDFDEDFFEDEFDDAFERADGATEQEEPGNVRRRARGFDPRRPHLGDGTDAPSEQHYPLRPRSCGEFYYWDGRACVDARKYPPYVGPKP